jgi:hypothetical protein
MRPSPPVRVAGMALILTLIAATPDPARAFFSTTGQGNASANVSQLTELAITGATPAAGGTVALSWKAVTPPGPGAVTYTVSRNGGEPGGTCPSTSTPAPVTSCVDSDLGVGTYSYVITARWRSWSASSSASTAKITVVPATHLDIKAASTTPIAGAADNLTITAQDANDNTVTTYTGSKSLTFSGASASPGGTNPTVGNSSGTAIAFGTATAISFSSGVAKVSSSKNGVMRLYRSGPASIGVSDGSISSSPDLAVTVALAATSKISLTAASPTPTAGTPTSLTVTVSDTYGNPLPTYNGSHDLTFSGASASPSGSAPTVSNSSGTAVPFGSATAIDFSAGVASVDGASNGAMTLYKSGSSSLKVSDGSLTSATTAVTVAAAPASSFTLAAASTTPAAGAANSLTTTAFDPYGNTATSYTGSKALTFSGSSASPSGTLPTVADSAGTAIAFGSPTAISFSAGVAKVSSSKNGVMKLNRAGAASIVVSDGAISNPVPLAVTVSPGSAARLAFSNVSISAGVLGSTCLFTCAVTELGNGGTITARINVTDSLGNTASSVGSGHGVKVTSNGGTIGGGTLTIASSGPAESTTQFTYTAKASGGFSDTITAATSQGTTYTGATLTASK